MPVTLRVLTKGLLLTERRCFGITLSMTQSVILSAAKDLL